MRYLSPLRYPGGKEKIAPFLGRVIGDQSRRCTTYIEPFAGGAGAALALLFDEVVESVVLNDVNPGLCAFWRLTLEEPDRLIEKILTCDITVKTWHQQREVYVAGAGGDFELGFATFYLNRTNRSGILHARPIGGLSQTGRWKIDARFNREKLAAKVRLIAGYRDRITVEELDARVLVEKYVESLSKAFFYVDPPYLQQGDELYMNTLCWPDHLELAEILQTKATQWIVTYDCDPRVIGKLYPGLRAGIFGISHTAAKQHVGKEYFVVSDSLVVNSLHGFGPRAAQWL